MISQRCILAVLGLLFAPPGRAELPPLIPRTAFFTPAPKDQPTLSPDGKRMAFLAPNETGAPNLWVQELDTDRVVEITHYPSGLGAYQWAADGRHILFFQDKDGDEVNHLYSIDLDTKQTRDLTPHEGVKAQNLLLDARHPHKLLVGMNRRDRRIFDMYRVDLESGASQLEVENPGDVLSWVADGHFVIRAATAFRPDTGATLVRVRKDRNSPWIDLVNMPFERGLMLGQANGGSLVIGFTPDGKALDIVSALHSDKARIERIDAASGRRLKVLAEDPLCDVATWLQPLRPLTLVRPRDGQLQAVGFEQLKPKWRYLDAALGRDLEALQKRTGGFLFPVSRDTRDRKWILWLMREDAPMKYLLHDRRTRRTRDLFQDLPGLAAHALSQRKGIMIKARDGLDLACYLTLPVGVSARNLPLVLNPHGGPWARDEWGFDLDAQFLANRGYAVLQVNFRGSTGFGVAFLNAGNHQLGLGMQQDLYDALDWVVGQGLVDPKRVAVYGASAGGYATLRALADAPSRFRCGVDMVGPSDLATLLATMPPEWVPVKRRWVRRIGPVDQDKALNEALSPLFHVDAIKAPLMVVQGAHDPRVKVQHSDAVVAAARAKGLPVTYLFYPDEGHGLARDENNLDFYGRFEAFLALHLGGRAEPWAPVKGCSVELH